MGISTGDPSAQHFAVDHSDPVHRLVPASTGNRLNETVKQLQRLFGDLVRQSKWRAVGDRHGFKECLAEIKVPTMVIGGEESLK